MIQSNKEIGTSSKKSIRVNIQNDSYYIEKEIDELNDILKFDT